MFSYTKTVLLIQLVGQLRAAVVANIGRVSPNVSTFCRDTPTAPRNVQTFGKLKLAKCDCAKIAKEFTGP